MYGAAFMLSVASVLVCGCHYNDNNYCCCAGYSNQLNEPVCQPYQPCRISSSLHRTAQHWHILHGVVFCVSSDCQCPVQLFTIEH